MDSELELNRSKSTVSVFVNGKFLLSKFFKIRAARCKWMEEMTNQLKGVVSMHYEIKFAYVVRKEPKHLYQRRHKEEHRMMVTESLQEEKKKQETKIVIPIKEDILVKKKQEKHFYPRDKPEIKIPIIRPAASYSNHSPMKIASEGLD